MKREMYLQVLVLALTAVVVGLVLTAQSSGAQSVTSSPTTASSLPPGCKFIWCEDVNGCGATFHFWCNPDTDSCNLKKDSGSTIVGQCTLCVIGQFAIIAYQGVRRWVYDCTGDGQADCEYRYWWPIPKGIQTVCVVDDGKEATNL